MRFTLTVQMDNAAFTDGPNGLELSRILQGLSDRALVYGAMTVDEGPVRDSNGNTVGRWEVLES